MTKRTKTIIGVVVIAAAGYFGYDITFKEKEHITPEIDTTVVVDTKVVDPTRPELEDSLLELETKEETR